MIPPILGEFILQVLQVFDGEIPKPKEQVEQEQDVDRINE